MLLLVFEKKHDWETGAGGCMYTRTGLESVPTDQSQGHL